MIFSSIPNKNGSKLSLYSIIINSDSFGVAIKNGGHHFIRNKTFWRFCRIKSGPRNYYH